MTDTYDRDAVAALMDAIFCALIGEGPTQLYHDEEQIRSAPHSDKVDVLVEGQWYRVTAASIAEPISVEEHRDGADQPIVRSLL